MAIQQLRDSGLFDERGPQSNGSVCFTVQGWEDASIYFRPYATKADELHIMHSPLNLDKFPNNQRLHDYIREHAHRDAYHGESDPARSYTLYAEHVDVVIMIIREGL